VLITEAASELRDGTRLIGDPKSLMIVVRSTPDAAAATVVSWPVSIRNHRSYFASADKRRFARRAGPST
jgi:hypothetical protein